MTTHAVSLLPLLGWDPSSEHYYLGEHTVNKVLFHQYLVWWLSTKPSESALKPYAQTSVDTKNKCTFLIYSNYLKNIWVIFFGCKIYEFKLIQKKVLISIDFYFITNRIKFIIKVFILFTIFIIITLETPNSFYST